MSIEKVRAYFEKEGIAHRIKELDSSSATVELAAKALGTLEKRIAKSLTFLVDETAVMIVTAGDAKINNAKFKAEFHTKAKMLTAEQVTILIGHSVGGVCPFAVNENVKIYLDVSLKRFDTVFPACGSSNSAIELTVEELEKYSHALKWVDVCKLPE